MKEIQSSDVQASSERIKTTEAAKAGRVTYEELKPVFSQEELARYNHVRKLAGKYKERRRAMNRTEREGRKPTIEEIDAYEEAKAGLAEVKRMQRQAIYRLIERGMARPEIIARHEINRQRKSERQKARRRRTKKDSQGADEESSKGQPSKGTETNPSGQAKNRGTAIKGLKKAEDDLKDKPLQSSSSIPPPSPLLSKVNHFIGRVRNQWHGDLPWASYHRALPNYFNLPSSPTLVPPKLIPRSWRFGLHGDRPAHLRV